MRRIAPVLLALLLAGCGTSVVVNDVPVERLRSTLLAYDPHETLRGGHLWVVRDVEWRHDRRAFVEVAGDLHCQFAWVPAVLTLGLWIPCDAAVSLRLVLPSGGSAPVLEARVLHHHQLLLLLPVLFGDERRERDLIEELLRRARVDAAALAAARALVEGVRAGDEAAVRAAMAPGALESVASMEVLEGWFGHEPVDVVTRRLAPDFRRDEDGVWRLHGR